jgi:hypothetical protein
MRVMEHNLAGVERFETAGVRHAFGSIDIKRAIQGAMGDTVALAKLLPKLLANLENSYMSLMACVEKGDMGNAKKLARLIWENSRAFGVMYVAKIAIKMEQAIKNEKDGAVDECVFVMGAALDNFEKEVDELCPKNRSI